MRQLLLCKRHAIFKVQGPTANSNSTPELDLNTVDTTGSATAGKEN